MGQAKYGPPLEAFGPHMTFRTNTLLLNTNQTLNPKILTNQPLNFLNFQEFCFMTTIENKNTTPFKNHTSTSMDCQIS